MCSSIMTIHVHDDVSYGYDLYVMFLLEILPIHNEKMCARQDFHRFLPFPFSYIPVSFSFKLRSCGLWKPQAHILFLPHTTMLFIVVSALGLVCPINHAVPIVNLRLIFTPESQIKQRVVGRTHKAFFPAAQNSGH